MKKLAVVVALFALALAGRAMAADAPAGHAGHDHATTAKAPEGVNPHETYACPMHKDVTSAKPGKCPKCGMNMDKLTLAQHGVKYRCPMHKDVVSDNPGTCEKCKMKLEVYDTTHELGKVKR